MSDDVYEVYAIKYGEVDKRRPDLFIGGDPHDTTIPLVFYVWAIVGAQRTVILDTGFDEARSRARQRRITRPVREGLAAIGVDPEAVGDVIISHLHWDHAGNDGLFPNARYHLQDCEMEFATGRCMCHGHLRATFEADDVTAMVRRVFAGRVAFHDGADEIAPGIAVHKIGGHSKGLQSVTVKTRRGVMVLCSDASHYYAHINEGRVFPIVYNVGDVLQGYETLKRLAPSPNHLVPGHDPLVLDLYPAARPGLEGWVVRLDAEPKPTPVR